MQPSCTLSVTNVFLTLNRILKQEPYIVVNMLISWVHQYLILLSDHHYIQECAPQIRTCMQSVELMIAKYQ